MAVGFLSGTLIMVLCDFIELWTKEIDFVVIGFCVIYFSLVFVPGRCVTKEILHIT